MVEEIKHYQVNGKYRVQYEQVGSAKGVIGFKVEANGDDLMTTLTEAHDLLERASQSAKAFSTETPTTK